MSLALMPLCRGSFLGALEDTFKIAPSTKYGTSPTLVPSLRLKGLPSSLATIKSRMEMSSFFAS